MDDLDIIKKVPPPLNVAQSRVGSEVSNFNDVEKTFDAIYKAHDQIVIMTFLKINRMNTLMTMKKKKSRIGPTLMANLITVLIKG